MYGFSVLWKLFKSGLLVTNAVAILHKQRFLRKCEHNDETNQNNTYDTYDVPGTMVPGSSFLLLPVSLQTAG